MPAEKLLTSISKPGLILPSQIASSFFMSHAASGPMIIAPRNIGSVGAHDHAHGGDDTDDGAAHAVDHPAALRGDQDRQHVADHRADEAEVGLAVGVLAEAADAADREPARSR